MSKEALRECNRWFGALLGLALLFALAPTALAAPDNFVHGRPSLYLDESNVLSLALPLSVDNEDALGDLLRDGASLELRVKITVQRKRGLWFNASMLENEYSSLLRLDPLTREFKMTMPGSEQILQDKSLRSLLSRTWKEMRLPIVEASFFSPKSDYLIKIELSLKHTALPPWLDRTLVFWNKDVVNPASFELEYKVKDAAVSR